MQLHGPWKFQNPAARYLLEGNRVTIALECLIKRKRCFLEHPDWKTIPWAADVGSKTMGLLLHDILCDVPGLLEDAITLQRSKGGDQKLSLHRELSTKILVHLRTLYEWRASWQQQNPSSCHEVPTSFLDSQSLFPMVFYYSDLSAANEICFYNAILLLLLNLGSKVIGLSFDHSLPSLHLPRDLDFSPLYAPGLALNADAVATEICRSVEYHLLHTASSVAAFFLLFPLRLAYETFKTTSDESQWLSGMMKNIADMSGFEIGRTLGRKEVVLTSS
jgi:hypothetical protein